MNYAKHQTSEMAEQTENHEEELASPDNIKSGVDIRQQMELG